MNLYILGIIFFVLVIIICTILLIYYRNDEKNLKEVTNEELKQKGKFYTKEEFENRMFEQYSNILMNTQYEHYSFLKDAVSDEVYNQILLKAKQTHEKQEQNIIQNIKKEFCKLISFEFIQNLEVAKLWVRYSSIEYIKGLRKEVSNDGQEILVERVVEGNENTPISHEYILTFVKEKTETEKIVCPSCGYQTHMLTTSHCIRCDSEIVPKSKHWVFVEKNIININKEN